MAEMTKEEWGEKDRRIVKQSMLKAAVEWLKDNKKIDAHDVLRVADVFVDWVYGENNQKTDENIVSTIEHPVPTLDQKKALEKVEKETGKNTAQVWAMFGKFPVESNVKACIQKIKEKNAQ